jgi:hypothetical protein
MLEVRTCRHLARQIEGRGENQRQSERRKFSQKKFCAGPGEVSADPHAPGQCPRLSRADNAPTGTPGCWPRPKPHRAPSSKPRRGRALQATPIGRSGEAKFQRFIGRITRYLAARGLAASSGLIAQAVAEVLVGLFGGRHSSNPAVIAAMARKVEPLVHAARPAEASSLVN